MSVAVPDAVASLAPSPNEGCPPPLRCRDVWRNVHDTTAVWERTSARGARLSGWTIGRGPTVVFLSPFGGTRDLFALTAWLLRDEIRSIAIDWRATGRSPTLTDFAADVWDVVSPDLEGPANLYGISWSGAIALEATRQRRDAVGKVFVQDGFAQRRLSLGERALAQAALWSRRTLAQCPQREYVQRLNHRRWFPPLDPDRWSCFLETTGALPVSVLARQGLACHKVDVRRIVENWQTPTWLISTEGAGPRAHQHHAELQAALPSAQSEWMHTTGTHAAFTHPHRLAKFLRQALGVAPAAAPAESCCGGTDACATSVESPT